MSFDALTLMYRYDECLRCRPFLGVPELESSERVSERERSFSAFVLVSQNCIGPCCSAAELLHANLGFLLQIKHQLSTHREY